MVKSNRLWSKKKSNLINVNLKVDVFFLYICNMINEKIYGYISKNFDKIKGFEPPLMD